ncbi:hypothetical protein [Streptosporangium canum]|uniref:hypothetical protein n=1 Tax=Streptosporangium canum TaxID=324952 RepID=UPI0037A449E0
MPVVTAYLWRETGDDRRRVGEIDYPDGASDPDGAAYLFARLVDPFPEAFQRFAEDYYEVQWTLMRCGTSTPSVR